MGYPWVQLTGFLNGMKTVMLTSLLFFRVLGTTDRIFERDENEPIVVFRFIFESWVQLTGFLNGMKT